MSEAKVTRDEIFEICDKLMEAGKTPSATSIRDVIGYGSKSTIQRYLEGWRGEKTANESFQIKIPSELLAQSAKLTEGMWAQFNRLSAERIQSAYDAATSQFEQLRGDHEVTLGYLEELEGMLEQEKFLRVDAEAKNRDYELHITALETEIRLAAENLNTRDQDSRQKNEQERERVIVLEREVSALSKELVNRESRISDLMEEQVILKATIDEFVTERSQIQALSAIRDANAAAEIKRLTQDNQNYRAALKDEQQQSLTFQEQAISLREELASAKAKAKADALTLRLFMRKSSSFTNVADKVKPLE